MIYKGNLCKIYSYYEDYENNEYDSSVKKSKYFYIAMLKTDQTIDHALYFLRPMKVRIVEETTGQGCNNVLVMRYYNIEFPEDYTPRSYYSSDLIYITSENPDELNVEYQKLIDEWKLDKLQKMYEREIEQKLRFDQYLINSQKQFHGTELII